MLPDRSWRKMTLVGASLRLSRVSMGKGRRSIESRKSSITRPSTGPSFDLTRTGIRIQADLDRVGEHQFGPFGSGFEIGALKGALTPGRLRSRSRARPALRRGRRRPSLRNDEVSRSGTLRADLALAGQESRDR